MTSRIPCLVSVVLFVCGGCSQDTNTGEVTATPETTVFVPENAPEPELRGGNWRPINAKLRWDLADWGQLWFEEGELKKVRMVGFERYNDKPLDIVVDDPIVLRTIEEGLFFGTATRPAVSDLRKTGIYPAREIGVGYVGHRGVLKLYTADRELIIGVGSGEFYLGIWHGGTGQSFQSWLLAMQVYELLSKHSTIGGNLFQEEFDSLSGEGLIKRGKERFEELRRGAKTAGKK